MLQGALGDEETGMLFSAAYLRRSWRPLPAVSVDGIESNVKGNELELGDEFGHAPRGNDLQGRVAGRKGELEADLIVATLC